MREHDLDQTCRVHETRACTTCFAQAWNEAAAGISLVFDVLLMTPSGRDELEASLYFTDDADARDEWREAAAEFLRDVHYYADDDPRMDETTYWHDGMSDDR